MAYLKGVVPGWQFIEVYLATCTEVDPLIPLPLKNVFIMNFVYRLKNWCGESDGKIVIVVGEDYSSGIAYGICLVLYSDVFEKQFSFVAGRFFRRIDYHYSL